MCMYADLSAHVPAHDVVCTHVVANVVPTSVCLHERHHHAPPCREGEEEDMTPPGLDEKVIEVYKGVGRLLSRWVSRSLKGN